MDDGGDLDGDDINKRERSRSHTHTHAREPGFALNKWVRDIARKLSHVCLKQIRKPLSKSQ